MTLASELFVNLTGRSLNKGISDNMENIDRRTFLGKTALAGIGLAGATAILKGCRNSPAKPEYQLPPILRSAPDGKKLKAGLVGTGDRGLGVASDFLQSGPSLEIIALADAFQDQIDWGRSVMRSNNLPVPEEKNCFAGLDSYKKLMALPDLDVVLLATPPRFRPDHFFEAVTNNKHVFMEKPIAVDPKGCRSIIATAALATRRGLNVVTGTHYRHSEDYIETYKHVADGSIGRITSAKSWMNTGHVWYRVRSPEWSDMEYMIRNWNNFCWLSGDQIVESHIHNIDAVNWFVGKHPEIAMGFGGRHRRVSGDQYDFFSIDYDYGNGVSSHSMCRQIDGCANGNGELVIGTEGFTNCRNTIWDLDGRIKWKYRYPQDIDAHDIMTLYKTAYVQEQMHLVYAIRTGHYVNEAEQTALSTLTAIMGRTAAYTGQMVTWDAISTADGGLGPSNIQFGPVEMNFPVPIPGVPH